MTATATAPDPRATQAQPYTPRAFFFGVYRETGHYLYRRTVDRPGEPARLVSENDRRTTAELPISYAQLDGLFPPREPGQRQGVARVCFFDGWTFVSFWDRSGPDKRMGCNSTFILEGELNSRQAAVKLAEALFPMVWERFPFDVTLDVPRAARGA